MSGLALVFVESRGLPPRPETLAAKLLHACSIDDEEVWDALGIREMTESDLVAAVDQLRALGWEFYYGELQ